MTGSRSIRGALALAFLLAGLRPSTATASGESANDNEKRHDAGQEEGALVRQGSDCFLRHDYEGARVALRRAYDLNPRADTVLKLGVAELQSGHPVEAVLHLRQFLTHTGRSQHPRSIPSERNGYRAPKPRSPRARGIRSSGSAGARRRRHLSASRPVDGGPSACGGAERLGGDFRWRTRRECASGRVRRSAARHGQRRGTGRTALSARPRCATLTSDRRASCARQGESGVTGAMLGRATNGSRPSLSAPPRLPPRVSLSASRSRSNKTRRTPVG